MKPYVTPGSCALACHHALEWAAAPYKPEVPDHDAVGAAAYRAVNPTWRVPAPRLDDVAITTGAQAAFRARLHADPAVRRATAAERVA